MSRIGAGVAVLVVGSEYAHAEAREADAGSVELVPRTFLDIAGRYSKQDGRTPTEVGQQSFHSRKHLKSCVTALPMSWLRRC